jgi:hypothetical protein
MSKPLGPRKNLMLRLPEDLHAYLTLLATARKKKLNEILVQMLTEKWEEAPERDEIIKLQKGLAKLQKSAKRDDEGQHAAAA